MPAASADGGEPAYRNVNGSPASNIGTKAVDIAALPGRLIVLEGTDGAGRSTHCALLREHLEIRGFGVLNTGLSRGRLAGDGLRRGRQSPARLQF